MNPFPCGHHNARCRYTPDQVARYRSRISGPLLDRIDRAAQKCSFRGRNKPQAVAIPISSDVVVPARGIRSRSVRQLWPIIGGIKTI